MHSAILDKLQTCKTLPTLPAVATEVVRLSHNDETDMGELGRVVARDPVIAAKLISTANSPVFLTRGPPLTTIQQAVMRLGANTVMTLALSFSLTRLRGTEQGFDYARFWKRALASGTAARCVADYLRCNAEEAFLGGLFQDIGILALHELMGASYGPVLTAAGHDHLRLERIERETFGVDHREVGAWLATNWKLPAYLEHTTRSSHNPESVSGPGAFPELTRAVALSGFVADIWTGGADRAEATRQAAECSRQWASLGGEAFTRLLTNVARTLPEQSRLLEIPLDQKTLNGVIDEAREALVRVTLKSAQSVFAAEATASNLMKLREREEDEREGRRDPLTGLFNRQYFDAQLRSAHDGARTLDRPLSLILCDIDHLKSVNEKYGHQTGEAVLQTIGRMILRCMRQLDIPARYGGEEFVIILPATDRNGCGIAAERLRNLLSKQETAIGGGRSIQVTASFGCATMDAEFRVSDPLDLVRAADEAMFRAKRDGRNRVVVMEP